MVESSMASSYRSHCFHLVWSTKERKKLILPHFESRLYAYMGGVIRASKGSLLEIGGVEDHVHLLVGLGNLDHYSVLIRNVKSNSSKWIHEEFPEMRDFGWQDGYGSFSVCQTQLEGIRSYVQNQKIRHQTQSFEQEYISILERFNVPYDPKFVFG